MKVFQEGNPYWSVAKVVVYSNESRLTFGAIMKETEKLQKKKKLTGRPRETSKLKNWKLKAMSIKYGK